MSKCTDDIWMESVIRDAVAKYLVDARIINDEDDLNVDTGWDTYGITKPVSFDQLCAGVTKRINTRLKAEGCPKFAGIPAGQWTLDHLPKKVAVFISDVAVLILSPPQV